MVLCACHGNHEFSVLGGDLARVIPLDIASRPVVQVHGFPVGIVSRVECPTFAFELITEDEVVLFAIRTDAGQRIGRGIVIDQRWEIGQFVDLTGTIGGVEAISVWGVPAEGIDDRVGAEQGEESACQYEESQNVCPASARA